MDNVNRSVQQSGGIGFVGLLTILFIGLKLTGYITWSLWWVLSPIWISTLVVVGFFLVLVIGFIIIELLSKK